MSSFQCSDCGSLVYQAVRFTSEPKACYICRFIRHASPEDQGALRANLLDAQQMEHWNAIGAYRDETREERRCDHCDTPYRGPGVYCSRHCALADA